MRRVCCCIALLLFPLLVEAQNQNLQKGTIVRMRMTECLGPQHKFMTTMSGGANVETGAQCPEYIMVTDRVVYVISGKTSDALIPLAEVTRFHLQKNEMLIRIDDAQRESRLAIKEMVLRSEWEATQNHIREQMSGANPGDRPVAKKEDSARE